MHYLTQPIDGANLHGTDQPILGGLARMRDRRSIELAFDAAIRRSFEADGKNPREASGDAIRARFRACLKIFKILRGDKQWGLQRVLNHIGPYLVKEVQGIPWQPDDRVCWVPDDGN